MLVLLSLLLSAPLIADDQHGSIDGIYRGTIGHHTIVLEISRRSVAEQGTNYDEPEDRNTYPVTGSYFYRRHGVSIDLAGMPLADGSLRLREYRKRGALPYEFPAEWRLRFDDDTATGHFCKCDLSASARPGVPLLKIALRRVSRKTPSPEEWEHYKPHSGNAYYDLLLDFPLEIGRENGVTAAIAYRMRTDPRLNVSRPELTRFPDARVMARINAGLDAEFVESRVWASRCISAGRIGGVEGGSYDEIISVNVVQPVVLSLLVTSSWYTGGAHPNEDAYTLNYDLHTGKRFTLEKSFRAPGGGTAEADIAAVLARLYRRHYVKPLRIVAGEDCDIVLNQDTSGDENLTQVFSPGNALFISKSGFVVIPALVHADVGCGPPIAVPYREIRPYVKKHSLLRTVVERETFSHQ